MAIAIKPIPVLKKDSAKRFNSRARMAFVKKRGSVNFIKQVASAEKILEKATI